MRVIFHSRQDRVDTARSGMSVARKASLAFQDLVVDRVHIFGGEEHQRFANALIARSCFLMTAPTVFMTLALASGVDMSTVLS
jgi:hypothetical protein